MAREADQGRRQLERQREPRIAGIEAGLAHVPESTPLPPLPQTVSAMTPTRVGREAERLADLADGAAAAIGDHGGGQRGAGAALVP
jgi:hypothetical protein